MTDPLANWGALQEALKEIDEDNCWKLLREERSGKRRMQFLLRIHGRANKLRVERERYELVRE
jgi:hypothetical protein